MHTLPKQYCVRALHCDHRADDETVYETLKRATEPLTRAWDKLRAAKRIGIKFNQDYAPARTPYFEGMRQQLVSDQVARAVVRLLREETQAELFYVDTSVFHHEDTPGPVDSTHLAPIMREFGVPYVNADIPPFGVYQVPGGGQMFRQYVLPRAVMEADALVDVQRMKNHAFMGITLTLKNLFGLMPMREPEGRSRHYYHHLVRMPYMLADIGRLFNPALNIIDALIAQTGGEWSATGQEAPVVVNALIAGDHPVATDAVGAYLMGHDPQADWLTPPFHRDRNALLVAAEGGFGTVDLAEIDWTSEVSPQSPGIFFAAMTDDVARVISWRRTTCEQALYYRDHQRDFVAKYAGEFILLQENEVKWHDTSSFLRQSRRVLSGDRPDQAMWLKYVDPDEAEGEHFEVYERALADMAARGL
ncbi:MAG TPA: DUF362 domain-containing protein [Anaerolineae bacterium]|nr:DUF362 domain-containing protein [Anaerolineae bacterium]HQK14471.1 DUF362 domain-containing protein [Anaerolineae bacterium]